MNNILVIYKGWKIIKELKGYRVLAIVNGKSHYSSSILKTLSDAFMYCDSIDYMIAYRKIERGCEA